MLSTEDVTIGNSKAISGLSRETVRFVFIYTFDSINDIITDNASKVRRGLIIILYYVALHYTYVNIVTYEKYSRRENEQPIKHSIRNQAFPLFPRLMLIHVITIPSETF